MRNELIHGKPLIVCGSCRQSGNALLHLQSLTQKPNNHESIRVKILKERSQAIFSNYIITVITTSMRTTRLFYYYLFLVGYILLILVLMLHHSLWCIPSYMKLLYFNISLHNWQLRCSNRIFLEKSCIVWFLLKITYINNNLSIISSLNLLHYRYQDM